MASIARIKPPVEVAHFKKRARASSLIRFLASGVGLVVRAGPTC